MDHPQLSPFLPKPQPDPKDGAHVQQEAAPPLPPRRRRARQPVLRFWKYELASLALAAGILTTIVVILVHYNGQQLPQWPLSINLTTLVSLLSTVFRAATMAATVEVMGQLKWTWFRNPRSLLDVHRLDRASRGAAGSLSLLLRAPKDFLVVMCAIVTTISLAAGPFAQQAIRSVQCVATIPELRASIPVANFVQGSYYRVGAGFWEPSLDTKFAIIDALANPGGNDSNVRFSCPSGNCTFPEFEGVTHSSIGLCSSCIDSSSKVFNNGSYHNLLLSSLWVDNGYYKSLAVGEWDLEPAQSLFTPQFAVVAPNAIFNLSILTLTNSSCSTSPNYSGCSNNVTGDLGNNMRPLSVSCSLYPCLKDYRASIVNGQLEETLMTTSPASRYNQEIDHKLIKDIWNFTTVQTPCQIGGKMYAAANFSSLDPSHYMEAANVDGKNISVPYECLYKFGGTYARAIFLHMQKALSGSCSKKPGAPARILDCLDHFWLEPFFMSGEANITSVSQLMVTFTETLTNKLRTIGTSLYLSADGKTPAKVEVFGTVNTTTICTQVSWKWLALHAVLLVVSIGLVGVVIFEGYYRNDSPTWKTSLLPLLFYGFVDKPVVEGVLNIDELEKTAKNYRAQFTINEQVGFIGEGSHLARADDTQERSTRRCTYT